MSRQTVSEWSNLHWPFQTELSERRAQALRDVQQRLEEAALMAVEVLAQRLTSREAIRPGEVAALPHRSLGGNPLYPTAHSAVIENEILLVQGKLIPIPSVATSHSVPSQVMDSSEYMVPAVLLVKVPPMPQVM